MPLRELLVYPVVISISNYVCLAFLNISLKALLALFLAMPLEIGGLNLSPPIIGYMAPLVPYSMQFILRASSVVGENEGFSLRQSTFFPVFLLLPLINFAARGWGRLSFGVCILIGVLLILMSLMDVAYGARTCSPSQGFFVSFPFRSNLYVYHRLCTQ